MEAETGTETVVGVFHVQQRGQTHTASTESVCVTFIGYGGNWSTRGSGGRAFQCLCTVGTSLFSYWMTLKPSKRFSTGQQGVMGLHFPISLPLIAGGRDGTATAGSLGSCQWKRACGQADQGRRQEHVPGAQK